MQVRLHHNACYGFVSLVDETLASTMVQLKSISLGDCVAHIAWPSGKTLDVSRASPSLDLCDNKSENGNVDMRCDREILVGGNTPLDESHVLWMTI